MRRDFLITNINIKKEVKLKNAKEKRKSKFTSIILVLVFVAAIVIVVLLMNGKTTITGDFEGSKKIETLACWSDTISYPIFKYDNSSTKSLKINAMFENEKLSSISLYYKLGYPNEEMMRKSESVNHAAMNLSFYDNGMGTDDLEAKYSFVNNSLQMSIYIKSANLDNKSLRYFMLDGSQEVSSLSEWTMAEAYNDIGLNCEIK